MKKITTVAQEQFNMAGERIKEVEGDQQKLYIYNMKNVEKKTEEKMRRTLEIWTTSRIPTYM